MANTTLPPDEQEIKTFFETASKEKQLDFIGRFNRRLSNDQVVQKGLQQLSDKELEEFKATNEMKLRVLTSNSEAKSWLTNMYTVDAANTVTELGDKHSNAGGHVIPKAAMPVSYWVVPASVGILTATALRSKGMATRILSGLAAGGAAVGFEGLIGFESLMGHCNTLVLSQREKETRDNLNFVEKEIVRRHPPAASADQGPRK